MEMEQSVYKMVKENDRSIALLVLANMIVSYIVIIEFVNTFHIVIHTASFSNVTRYVSYFQPNERS